MIGDAEFPTLFQKSYNHDIELSEVLRLLDATIEGGHFNEIRSSFVDFWGENAAVLEGLGVAKEKAEQISNAQLDKIECDDQDLGAQVIFQVQRDMLIDLMRTCTPQKKVKLSNLDLLFLLKRKDYQLIGEDKFAEAFVAFLRSLTYEAVTSTMEQEGVKFDFRTSFSILDLRLRLQQTLEEIIIAKLGNKI